MAKFLMMIGLPGSGKSTFANELAITEDALIFSSDAYRAKYGDGEEDQSKNSLIFGLLRRDLMAALNANKNVILDATNISIKARRSWLNSLPKHVQRIAHLVLAPYEVCLYHNAQRDRVVPEYVIKRMYKQFDVPSIEEGFDVIITHYVTRNARTFNIDKFFETYDSMSQDNAHHTLTVGEHMRRAYEICCDQYPELDDEVKLATLLHDIGKPFCKVFQDSNGNETTEAHYYGHEHVGAYDVMFLANSPKTSKLRVAWLINHHMDPFNWNNESARKRWIERWGMNNYELIEKIHNADVFAK